MSAAVLMDEKSGLQLIDRMTIEQDMTLVALNTPSEELFPGTGHHKAACYLFLCVVAGRCGC